MDKKTWSKPPSFQEVVLRLQAYWAQHGCLIWQPYSEKVGAGTANPATTLRVLGPEPWNVCYIEPSYRPDDGRYAENPNRMQMHIQLQVILKPDPGNPQELYLGSLEAVGIDRTQHDIRFVEDNWESPALGAWGLGWEVWCDGLEITQFTYFQQAGGQTLDPVAVELTYGLERIVMFLQGKRSVWEIDWGAGRTYGDVLRTPEIEHCIYDFEAASVERLTEMYRLYEAEARACLSHEPPLVIPAHDYVLRCSHTFNVLDARGAIGVTERASYFARMRALSRDVASAYIEQRQREEYPWLKKAPTSRRKVKGPSRRPPIVSHPVCFLLELGVEELPAGDLTTALAQLRESVPKMLDEVRLEYSAIDVYGTPRRLAVLVSNLAPYQKPIERMVRGPAARAAFDAAGKPTRAAEGFARSQGVAVQDLQIRDLDGGQYVVAVKRDEGQPAAHVLAERLPGLIAGIKFDRAMRWNYTNVAFSRPIRWLVALLGDAIVPFEYAGISSGRTTFGTRSEGVLPIEISSAVDYLGVLSQHHIIADVNERREAIRKQVAQLAASVGGQIVDLPDLLDEVTNLVEQPTALIGRFEDRYLALPRQVLVTVMRKHQRYFPVQKDGQLMPYFVTVRNGGKRHSEIVQHGNEQVLRARFADAEYFFRHDIARPLEELMPRLGTLTFQEKLGSVLDKVYRIEQLVPHIAEMLGLSEQELQAARRAAHLCKADLATQMVVEFTSLQGVMGREYALRQGEPPEVALAIEEHYLPRFAGDRLPCSLPGTALGLADRLDSLVGLFAVGLAPTGSADPWAMRRTALGAVQILVENMTPFSLRRALEAAADVQPSSVLADRQAVLNDVQAFIIGRLRALLLEQGFRYDLVDAVLSEQGDVPYRARIAVQALTRWAARPDWNDILANYARCVRITREFAETFPLDITRDPEPMSHVLYDAYQECAAKVALHSSIDGFFSAFVSLVPTIARFFVDVLVMTEDRTVRETRLALLQRIAALPKGIVDLSKVEGF